MHYDGGMVSGKILFLEIPDPHAWKFTSTNQKFDFYIKLFGVKNSIFILNYLELY